MKHIPNENISKNTTTVNATTHQNEMRLKQYILSSENLMLSFWMAINYLRFVFFLGNLDTWLNKVTHGDKDQGRTLLIALILKKC